MAQKPETVVRLRRSPGFLRNFKLSATQFVKPDFATGRPGLPEALFDGVPVLIKHWLLACPPYDKGVITLAREAFADRG